MEGGGRGRHGRGLSRGLPPAGLGRPEGERKPPLPRLWGGSLPRRACGYSSGETAPREADDLPLGVVWGPLESQTSPVASRGSPQGSHPAEPSIPVSPQYR